MNARLTGLLMAFLLAPAGRAAEPRLDLYGDPLPEGAVARLGTVRFHTDETIRSLAYSPDGRRVAAECDHALFVFDAESGRMLRRLGFANGQAGPWAWLPDGRGVLLLHDEPGNARLVDFTDEKLELPASGQGPAVWRRAVGANRIAARNRVGPFAFLPGGRLLAAEAYDPQARARFVGLWEAVPGKRFRDLKLVRSLGPPPGDCGELCFTPDGKALGAFCAGGTKAGELFVLWDLQTARERCRRDVRAVIQGEPRVFALSPDGRRLAFRADVGTAQMLDLTKDTPPRDLEYPNGGSPDWATVTALAFSRDGTFLVTAGRDRMVRAWDPGRFRAAPAAADTLEWVEAIAFSPDGKRLVTGGQANVVRQWDAGTFRDVGDAVGHRGVVRDAVATPGGATAVTAGDDGTLRVWDLATGRPLRQVSVKGHIDSRLSVAADGRTVVTTVDQSLRAWDVTTGRAVPLPGPLARADFYSHGFVPDGRGLLLSRDQSVSLWDFPTGRRLKTFELNGDARLHRSEEILDACLSPDGKRLVTCTTPSPLSEPGHADVWDTATRKRVARLGYVYPGGVTSVFVPGERSTILVARGVNISPPGAGRGPALSLWDSQTGKPLQPFTPAAAGAPDQQALFIHGMARSPDARTVAVAQENGALLYEVATGQGRLRLGGHRSGVLAAAFTPDGRRLITAGDDQTALVWDVTLAGAAARLKAPTGRERAALWVKLADAPARDAFEAMARLAADPAAAVALAREHLRPAPTPEPAALDFLVGRLDHGRFAVRQQASAELIRLGRVATKPLRERLAKVSSAEVRGRLERIIEEQLWHGLTPEELRHGRAVELLEGIGTPEARSLLRELARGEPEALLTQQAAASLRRLEK